MVISTSGKVAGAASGNCLANATLAQPNVTPQDRGYKIMCDNKCHEITTEVKYVKTETVVVGCAEGKTIARISFSAQGRLTKLKCEKKYELKKLNITTLIESKNGDYRIGMKEVEYCAKRVN